MATTTGVLENTQPAEKGEPQVTFNEQTNYVPKRTIITVSAIVFSPRDIY